MEFPTEVLRELHSRFTSHPVVLEHLPAPEPDTLDDDIVIEYFADARWRQLSNNTRDVVVSVFNGDLDEALFVGSRIVANHRRPPSWALELWTAYRNDWRTV